MDSNRDMTVVRAAEPTLEQGHAYARYADQAAEGFFRFWLGPRFVDIVAAAYLEPRHDLSYEHATFALRSGTMLGMVSAFTAADHQLSTRVPLRRAAGRLPLRMLVVAVLCSPMFRILDSIEEGDFYIQSVAVDPEARGCGVGSTLLDWVEEEGVRRGARRLSLHVAAGNTAARRLYKHRGMRVESRWPRRLRLPKIEMLRMVKEV